MEKGEEERELKAGEEGFVGVEMRVARGGRRRGGSWLVIVVRAADEVGCVGLECCSGGEEEDESLEIEMGAGRDLRFGEVCTMGESKVSMSGSVLSSLSCG